MQNIAQFTGINHGICLKHKAQRLDNQKEY